MSTKIEWTEETWNPVVGCRKVSDGCQHCYAETMARRLAGVSRAKRERGEDPGGFAPYEQVIGDDGKWTGHAVTVPERLYEPLSWRKPRRVFVCSMSDLFHEDVSFWYIVYVIDDIAARCPKHTFQVLTKRPHRMIKFFKWREEEVGYWDIPSNIELGVTAENQQAADERIPLLLQCPATVRFVSCEPLLGPIDFDYDTDICQCGDYVKNHGPGSSHTAVPMIDSYLHDGLDWVIVGGESGHGARPMDPDWARSLRDQCQDAGVAFFFKQIGTAWAKLHGCRDSHGGDMSEWPEDLRVREYPEPRQC
jgi:protein gp37